MFNKQYNIQYNSNGINEINISVTSRTQSTSTASASVQNGIISRTTSQTSITFKLEHHTSVASESNSQSTVNVKRIMRQMIKSQSQSSSNLTYLIQKHVKLKSVSLSESNAKAHMRLYGSATSSTQSRSSARADVYSYAPPIDYKSLEQTPIWIYDKDEQLQLVLLPRNQTENDEQAIPYTNGWYTEQLNGKVSLEFEVPAMPDTALIEPDGRAVIQDQDGNFVEFIIRQPEDSYGDMSTKIVFAEGADYELIDEWVPSYTQASVDLETALTAVLQGTRWSVGEIGYFGDKPVDLKRLSAKAAVHKLTEIFGGERRYRVEADHNTITKRYIDILPKRGERTGKRFEAGKDIVSARRTPDTTGIKTALYGYGASGENDGPRLTFADVEWSKAKGDPVDKPLGQTWVGDPEALNKWGYDQGRRHRKGAYDGQEEDPAELLLNTWNHLQTINDAVYTYEQDVILLEQLTGYDHEKVRLGDSVDSIVRDVYPAIETEETIIEYRQNLNDVTQSKVTLGSFRRYFDTNEAVRDVQETVNDNQGNWNNKPNKDEVQGEIAQKVDEAIQEAQERIDQAKTELEQAMKDIEQGQIDLQDAQALIDDTIANPQDYKGSIEGLIIAEDLIVQNAITAYNATVTGTLLANNLTIMQATIDKANIIDANIQDATITGTLDSVDGRFVGELIGARIYAQNTVFVGDELTVTKTINLGNFYDGAKSKITFSDRASLRATDFGIECTGDSFRIEGNGGNSVEMVKHPENPALEFYYTSAYKSRVFQDNDDSYRLKLESRDGEGASIYLDPNGTIYFLYNGRVFKTFYSNGIIE
ncbi:phage tail spike protein [Virgibacillus sp. FSP13]